ncbi:N-acetyltransferase [Clavibacter michiganensis]|uniref:GNAT family N-acetyltransferase n=1 Tax=Clavibacter michiganensis TaxID=28447 RepID=UPI000CE7298B|nr:GNAT family N-acetyltransferase [Clavibacter michiganensis]PPF90591.1 N-acetyltransferase [Clavibacter michiganensis]PPF92973.1 N-acetyltransferase [Clavibacter michiganensis]
MPTARLAAPEDRTARLDLHRPSPDDAAEVHAILSDPAVWTHYPSLRVTDPAQTDRFLRARTEAWERDGLGTWIVRERHTDAVVGFGGCGIAHDAFWNLGYRFSPAVQGRGYATEMAVRSIARARIHRPELPIVAYLVAHNRASAAVAERAGLTLVHRGPDPGNPDPGVLRLVYADRELSDAERDVTMR